MKIRMENWIGFIETTTLKPLDLVLREIMAQKKTMDSTERLIFTHFVISATFDHWKWTADHIIISLYFGWPAFHL